MNLGPNTKRTALLFAAFTVFLITFLSFSDISFWEDAIPIWGWWFLGIAPVVTLGWAGRIILAADNIPSLERSTGMLAAAGALGSLVLLFLLSVVEIWTELNDTFIDTAWGILGIVTIIAAVLLLVVVRRNNDSVFSGSSA